MQQCIDPNPEKRPSNMSTFKTRLERLKWKDAPKPRTTSVTEAPIHVLTVQEKGFLQQQWEEKRKYILLAILGILAYIAFFVNMFGG